MQNAFDRIAFVHMYEEENTKGSEENFAKGSSSSKSKQQRMKIKKTTQQTNNRKSVVLCVFELVVAYQT